MPHWSKIGSGFSPIKHHTDHGTCRHIQKNKNQLTQLIVDNSGFCSKQVVRMLYGSSKQPVVNRRIQNNDKWNQLTETVHFPIKFSGM